MPRAKSETGKTRRKLEGGALNGRGPFLESTAATYHYSRAFAPSPSSIMPSSAALICNASTLL